MSYKRQMDLELREHLRQEDEKMKRKFYISLAAVCAIGFVMGLMTI